MAVHGEGRFIVLVGIDGSGKTSLLSSVSNDSLVTASWQDLRNHELPAAMAPTSPTIIKNRLPDVPRAMFIGGHIVAQFEYLVRPQLTLGKNVLLDSYWYKVVAKEGVLGKLHPVLADLCEQLPIPDAVILLDTDPHIAFRRKEGMPTSYECLDTHDLPGFLTFQRALRDRIEFELRNHPQVYRLDGNADRSVVEQSMNEIIDRCTQAQPLVAGPLP